MKNQGIGGAASAAALAVVLSLASSLYASDTVPVRSLRDPASMGETRTVEGVVTDDPERTGRGGGLRIYLQDETGGLRVVADDAELLASVRMGDRLRVHGVVSTARGRLRLEAESLENLGGGFVPAPLDVSAAEAASDGHLGRRVRVTGQIDFPPDFEKTGRGLAVRDDSGEIRVPLSDRFLRNVEFAKRLVPGARVSIVGIPELFAFGDRVTHRLRVREVADFQFAPKPAYAQVGATLAVAAALGIIFFLVARRRQAERYAAEIDAVLRDLQQSQRDLAASETRFRALVENTTDIVWETGTDFAYTYCSPNILTILGYNYEEVLGKTLFEFAVEDEAERLRESFGELDDTGKFKLLERRVRAKDGRIVTLESGGKGVFDSNGELTGYRGVDRDITARRQLEAEVRQGQKMEAVGRLAGGIAHDFNNTLTVISACTSLLEDSRDEEVRRYARSINKAVDRSAGMTRQLLTFSRKQVVQPRIVDLNRLLRELKKMLGRLIGEDIEIISELGAGLWNVKADPTQMEQVVMNLVVNARDAMPSGGTIVLRTSNVTIQAGSAELFGSGQAGSAELFGSGVDAGDYVRLTVRDTGHGMDRVTQAKIFEPFFTTKAEGKGTGLGLATVYGIVNQCGGAIHVESEPGQGTTFHILLPKTQQVAPESDGIAATKESAKGTVLLVEDEEPVRNLTSEVLSNRGYRVLAASGRDDALAICREFSGNIDVLLADVVMPKASGPSVAAEIVAMRPSTCVLYMSGYTDDMIGSHGVLDPDVNLVYKPFTPEGLINALAGVLRIREEQSVGLVS